MPFETVIGELGNKTVPNKEPREVITGMSDMSVSVADVAAIMRVSLFAMQKLPWWQWNP